MRSCLYVPVWLALALVVMSCASTPRIANWQHKPFHPDNNENIEFRIQASDTGGVATVKLSLFEYELYVGSGGMKSARPRSGGTWGVVKTWNLSPAQTAVDLTHTVSGFPASSKITYTFEVTNTDGRSRSVEARFDAGTSPWPNSSITLWSSTPRSPSKTIDIMLLPDEDYNGNWDEFLDDVREMIYEGYHTNNMITGNRDKYTFYYSRAEGDAEGWPNWKLDIPSSVSSLPHIDVFCIVHKNVHRDVRSGNRFSTEAINVGTAVHETGHAVFDLADEYCCDGGYREISPHSNLFENSADCSACGGAGSCRSFTDSNGNDWFSPEAVSPTCIMRNDGDASMPDFQCACRQRINWYYTELIN